ncbi:MAG: DUF2851 family protein [Cytophagales bacterium]|nr:DUF2851 family protein [Cytophagales bacterium]
MIKTTPVQEKTPVISTPAIFKNMDERFLHYVWRFQQFDAGNLFSTSNEAVSIYHPGTLNHNSGPDFSEARLRIGPMEWAGQVEIHLRSSDWLRHGHQSDAAYHNVVLHVVYEHDKTISNLDGSPIPTLELKDRIHSDQFEKYHRLRHDAAGIPCTSNIQRVPEIIRTATIDRMVMERLEQKTKEVVDGLKTDLHDWEAATMHLLARSLGMKTNAHTFGEFANSVPWNKLSRHHDFQKEALIFGLAGFLDDQPQDEHQQALQKEFVFLKHKLGLTQKVSRHHWKFSKLRPPNFPTVRLSQLLAILQKESRLFSKLIGATSIKEVEACLQVPLSNYWSNHYDFAKGSKKVIGPIGKTTLDSIVINAVVPLLVAYGRAIDEQSLIEKAISWLEKMGPENNVITRKWDEIGLENQSALQSQGLIQLYKNYCSRRRCLQCGIGNKILNMA